MGMFDFNDVKLSGEEIVRIAQRDGFSILRVAISSNGYRQTQGFWAIPMRQKSTKAKRWQCLLI